MGAYPLFLSRLWQTIGFRIVAHPERLQALIIQNANVSEDWAPSGPP